MRFNANYLYKTSFSQGTYFYLDTSKITVAKGKAICEITGKTRAFHSTGYADDHDSFPAVVTYTIYGRSVAVSGTVEFTTLTRNYLLFVPGGKNRSVVEKYYASVLSS